MSGPPSSDATSDLGEGRPLGRYRLVSQLAVGGMAEIYVAKTTGLSGFEKVLALKLIHPNYSADPDFVRMLVDEAKLAVQLQHANIVQTFDLGRVDDQYYIAMELVDGADLYRLLRRASERNIDFPFELAAFIAREVCLGLDYAHRKHDPQGRPLEIVHRDISPQNVLVTFDGEVKICDFGIAKAAMREQQTAAGVIKGKYYYMSPEQAWGDPIDARTDVFSTGILLYEMLIGQMLYLEEDLHHLLDLVRKADIRPPSSKRPGVPEGLERIIMRALARSADDRFPSAGDFAAALTDWLHHDAPDMNATRLSAFMHEILERKAPPPDLADTASSPEFKRDEHSLLFRLADLAEPAAAPPRPANQATNLVGRGGSATSDFGESEATIVDASGSALMASLRSEEPTMDRPGKKLRDLTPAGLDLRDDPALDGPTRQIDDSGVVTVTRFGPDSSLPPASLPGVRGAPPPFAEPSLSSTEDAEEQTRLRRVPPRATAPAAEPPVMKRPASAPPPLPALSPAGASRPQTPALAPAPPPPAPATPLLPIDFAPAIAATPAAPAAAGPVAPSREDAVTIDPSLKTNTSAVLAALADLRPRRSRFTIVLIAAVGTAAAALVIALWLSSGSPARASLEVVSLPSGAEVRIDGNAVSQPTPVDIPNIDPQRPHHVSVSARGYDVWESDVRFEGLAQKVRLQAVLVPIVGSLDISSTPPGAEAVVNGRIAGTTPTTVNDLPPNDDVAVELRLRGYKVAQRTFSWNGKRHLSVSVPLEKAR